MPADQFGVYLVEGVVEQDPMTDRFVIQTMDQSGKPVVFDPQSVLEKLKGQEIRVIIAPLASIEEVERAVAAAEGKS